MTKLLILLSISFASPWSFAAYSSLEDLQNTLANAGHPVVIKVSPSVEILDYISKKHLTMNDYVNKNINNRIRLPSFDFVNEDGKITQEAYRVTDAFVCYAEITKALRVRRAATDLLNPGGGAKLPLLFEYCITIPAKITEVEKDLSVVRFRDQRDPRGAFDPESVQ